MNIEELRKALSTSGLQKVRMYSPPDATARIAVPQATDTFFYTAGRMLSYFPKINENGMAFFREDCKGVAKTLMASMSDVQHEKPNYPDNPKNVNKSIGAICDVLEHEEGIDICCKIEREVAKGLGYTAEDFMPGKGQFAKYSQECDFRPLDTSWIVVDKNDPTKLVKEVGYLEGLVAGYRCSRVVDGQWQHYFDDGNPVYIRVRPTSFSGVGHVINPADTSAQIYNYSADNSTKQVLVSFFPGIDAPNNDVPADMVTNVGDVTGEDANWMANDFQTHPDLITSALNLQTCDLFCSGHDAKEPYGDVHYADPGFQADKKKRYPLDDPEHTRAAAHYFGKPENKAKYSKEQQGHIADQIRRAEERFGVGDHAESCYAAVYTDPDEKTGLPVQKKALRIRDRDGNYDRNKLIAAYHALLGLRGDIATVRNIPLMVRTHALALVRQGLNETKPKVKETPTKSMSMSIEQELEALKLKEAELNKAISGHDTAVNAIKADYEKALASKDDEISTVKADLAKAVAENEKLVAKIKEFEDAAVAAERLAALEKVLAYTEDEKKAEAFDKFAKALASMSETEFKMELLTRHNTKLVAELEANKKAVASRVVGNPFPGFTAPTAETEEKLSLSDLY